VRHHRGQLAAVKVGVDPRRDMELVREAAMLTVARHPGVVALLALMKGRDGLELITGWVGTRSLAESHLLAPADGARVVSAVAATVADLHRHGIVHGSIDPSHVLLDEEGRPLLCSFGNAALVATAAADGPRPSDDVAALGELLIAVVGSPNDPELVPTRRFARRQEQHLHRSILTIADHARAHDRAARPSAASFAAALADLAPTRRAPTPRADDGGLDAELDRLRATAATVRARRRRWPYITGAAAIALVAIGVVGVLSGVTPSRAETRDPAPPPPALVVTTSTMPAPAPIVEIDHERYQVGTPGDKATVARWRCDDRPRVVLLRPATGELFLFDNAPEPGGDTAANPFTTVDHATSLAPVDPSDPCPTLVVLRGNRSAVPVELPAP
jgi:hypothetical protein